MNELLLEGFRTAYGEDFAAEFEKNGRMLEVANYSISDNFSAEPEVELVLAKALRLAGFHEAASPIGDNGKPRMLKLTAWIAHAGKPNKNRDAFTAEDLKEAVDNGLFKAPYFGMVDYNHDFNSYGMWYDAKYLFDNETGEWGILAEGALFAWRYSELADKMLGEQHRLGKIRVSMACMPQGVEFGEDGDGNYNVLRHPIFFTTSVLDVPQADAGARALGTEDTSQPSEERELLLSISSAQTDLTLESAHHSIDLEEENMDMEQLMETLRAALAENQAQFAEVFAAVARVPQLESELATATESLTEATARATTLEAELAEARVAQETATAALAEANTELETLREFRATAEAAQAEVALQELREARLSELTEAARSVVESKPEETREMLIARWVKLETEDWEAIRDSLNLAKIGKYEAATTREGLLAGGASNSGETTFEIDRFFSK
jgi:hypothetical protein